MIIPTLLFIVFSFLPARDVLPGLAPDGLMNILAGLAIVLAAPRILDGVPALLSKDSLLLLGLWGVVTLSNPMQGWFGGAVPALLAFSVPAVTFYLVVIALDRREAFSRLAVAAVLTALAISSLGLGEYYGLLHPAVAQDENDDPDEQPAGKFVMLQRIGPEEEENPEILRRIRGSGVLEDPNDLAQFLLVVAPFLLLAWRPGQPGRNFVLVVVPAAVLAHTLYLTHSRGALVGIAAMAAAWYHRKAGTKGLLVAAALVAVLLFAGFGGGRGLSSGEASAQGRIVAWSEGLQMLKQNPLFGVGFQGFTDFHEMTAHNSFVLCFAELGLVGYFFWLGLLVHGFCALRAAEASFDAGAARWAAVLTLSMVGYLATALFLSRTYASVLYFILAMSTALRYLHAPPEAAASPRNWLRKTFAGVVFSPACAYVAVMLTRITAGSGAR